MVVRNWNQSCRDALHACNLAHSISKEISHEPAYLDRRCRRHRARYPELLRLPLRKGSAARPHHPQRNSAAALAAEHDARRSVMGTISSGLYVCYRIRWV